MNIFHKTQKKETRKLPMTGKLRLFREYPVMGGYTHRRLIHHNNVIPADYDGVWEIF